ncbi:nuclear transport factor 2 family protein [Phenylobacterium sp. J367]|uniref:nuclear transport factor 2 family protein n=1 Tax=Phenylobacterium sp. J367 TaxID=2898435 RepID=UPI002151C42F|nr:nuclear transport factor 2 family protein [Phenylobacterium sp. J367]MCR5879162.1 nuclear transport factor 2 family protein [Phenylobacterium sp. J367]
MSLDLPSPIAAYVAANARLDADAMLAPFAADAVVRDNGAVLRGHAELRRLFDAEVIPVKAIFSPDSCATSTARWSSRGPAHGDYPGSPIRFTYRFTLENDAITALEITA